MTLTSYGSSPILGYMGQSLDDCVRSSPKFNTPESLARQAVFERAYSIANQVMTLRQKQGLTQKQLAKLCGVAQSEISRIERGAIRPTEPTLVKIADALGADLRLVERAPA